MKNKTDVLVITGIVVILLVIVSLSLHFRKPKEGFVMYTPPTSVVTSSPSAYEYVEPTPDSIGKEAEPDVKSINSSDSSVLVESDCINTQDEKNSYSNLLKSCNTSYSNGVISGISGVIRNGTYKNSYGDEILKYWSYVTITFDLYDSDNKFVCSVSAKSDRGLAVGKEWEFEAPVDYLVYKATKYKVSGIIPW